MLARSSFVDKGLATASQDEVANFPNVILIMVGNVPLPYGAAVRKIPTYPLPAQLPDCPPRRCCAKKDWVPTVGQETQPTKIPSVLASAGH